MYEFVLSGAQKSFLRGLGQTRDPDLKIGREGLTPAFFSELQRHLRAHELVKVRFLGAERGEQKTFCTRIADEGRCVLVGAVGHTALFFRQHPEPPARRVHFPGGEG